ncbi:hypothetical protein LCGC14_0836850 [marine sediment metagenome]|uniref:ATP-dependent DNA ligase family profile domain-containing protein n=1 Tax=marine sediment metagenome TaxID=412755 RepID=A0A0F9RZ24_9ZZZZ
MSEIKKPMLAETCKDSSTLVFPVLGTPKLDGIRCLVIGGRALSRKFKEIPNRHIQALVSKLPEGLDGELMLRDQSKPFQAVTSAVMREDGEPDFVYNVFDYVIDKLTMSYKGRMFQLQKLDVPEFVQKILPTVISTRSNLKTFEEKCLRHGYEGVMIRSFEGPYKCGRSTVREGFLLKIKRFKDSEATIVGFTARMHNTNVLKKDELGHAKRSSAKAGLVATATLGTLEVIDIKTNVPFEIGTGFDDVLRKKIWDDKSAVRGKIVKYKFQEVGTMDKPRFPVFLGFRDARDL